MAAVAICSHEKSVLIKDGGHVVSNDDKDWEAKVGRELAWYFELQL